MCPIQVKIVRLENNLFYDKQLMLHYKIEYPQFYSNNFQNTLTKINYIYKRNALGVIRECVDNFFKIAINYYIISMKMDIPIRIFEIYYIPAITYNENCALSLFYDKYLYAGGAHGITQRTSDTWDIISGKELNICDMFVNSRLNHFEYIKQNIINQISENLESEEFCYFENYRENILINFNENNFYLIPEGIKIYFQLYEIAPYAAGIPEFLIPFTAGITNEPDCR
ncbi:MAG: DUF3298 and DUF4163 domain-containing protein [Sedimentibacter sp.]